jgi:hypothetical protein
MNVAELWTAGVFAAITLLFLIIRFRADAYFMAAWLLVGGFIYGTWNLPPWRSESEFLLASAGLALYAFGLSIARVMLKRSVSLRILDAFAKGKGDSVAEESITSRIQDLEHYLLVRQNAHKYELSPFGRCIAGIVSVCYSVLRIP